MGSWSLSNCWSKRPSLGKVLKTSWEGYVSPSYVTQIFEVSRSCLFWSSLVTIFHCIICEAALQDCMCVFALHTSIIMGYSLVAGIWTIYCLLYFACIFYFSISPPSSPIKPLSPVTASMELARASSLSLVMIAQWKSFTSSLFSCWQPCSDLI